MNSPLVSVVPFVLALLATPARSQEAPPPKEAAYVIRLAGGPVLRTRAREIDGRIEIRREGEWIELPRESVERATPEAELLRESRRLERAAGDDVVLGVAHAGWCMEQGLVAEGLERLDRVLARDPDQEEARALLARQRLTIGSSEVDPGSGPEGLREYLARASSAGPAVREVALQRLASLAPDGGLRPELVRSLGQKSPRIRSFAALALRRLCPGEEVRPLLERAVLDASQDVRAEAARALRDVQDASVIAPVVRAMESRSSAVRLNAIDALSHMSYAAAVEPLYTRLVSLQGGATKSGAPRSHVFIGKQFAYVQDYDVEVAQGSAIADPVINVGIEGAALEASVLSMQDYVVQTERAALRSALEGLTGAAPGKTTEAWVRWWNDHGDEWLALTNQERGPSYPSSREQ